MSAALEPEGALANLGTFSASWLDAVALVRTDCGETLPLNPEVALVSTPDRSASLLADTAQAPKKMISKTVIAIAPTEMAIAALRLANGTMARTFYYPGAKVATFGVADGVTILWIWGKWADGCFGAERRRVALVGSDGCSGADLASDNGLPALLSCTWRRAVGWRGGG